MKIGDYVLFDDIAWVIIRKHKDGTYQIQTLEPLRIWINNIQVEPKDITVITKEVADVVRSVYESR